MKRLSGILATVLLATRAFAQDPAASPAPSPQQVKELEISGDDFKKAPETSSPKMSGEVDLAETPASDSFDIEPPADSPDPEKSAEVKGPLPGDEDVRPRPPVTGTVDVTAQDNNRTVHAKVGNLVSIKLESNPSTGYNWELRGFDFGPAVFHSSDLVARDKGNVLFGAPGDTVITLQAVEPGTQDIFLVYRRQWEPPDQIQATFAFQLQVEGTATTPSPAASAAASPVTSPAP